MDNYWGSFGPRSQDFWDGVTEDIKAFAVWKDGEQFVGIIRKPLSEVLAELPTGSEDDDGEEDEIAGRNP